MALHAAVVWERDKDSVENVRNNERHKRVTFLTAHQRPHV
jgi:hypothetical protein